jgi:hypothetical protein
MNGAHVETLFKCENHILAMTGLGFCDKTYDGIRREAKQSTGALGMVCSRKGVSR